MANLNKRREFVLRYCQCSVISGRKQYKYSLPNKLITLPNCNSYVCRQFFCKALDISFDFISWTIHHKDSENSTHCLPDARGGRKSSGNKCLSNSQYSDIIETFSGEKVQPSHYGRQGTSKFYFECTKTLTYFYRKYMGTVGKSPKKVHYDTFVKTVRAVFPDLSLAR